MVINFDKRIDDKIKNIRVNGEDGFEMVNVVTEGSMGWTVDDDTHTITFLGSTDVQITFEDDEQLDLYLQQFIYASGQPYNPYTQGLNNDPHYDKIPTGEIVPHTYTNTDVEQDLLND